MLLCDPNRGLLSLSRLLHTHTHARGKMEAVAAGVSTPKQKISQSDAKRIYCLTQKDIDNIKQASSSQGPGPHICTSGPSRPLDDTVVREYALRKHGGTQQGIELAVVEKQAAKLQREALMRSNVLVRKSRAVQVKI